MTPIESLVLVIEVFAIIVWRLFMACATATFAVLGLTIIIIVIGSIAGGIFIIIRKTLRGK